MTCARCFDRCLAVCECNESAPDWLVAVPDDNPLFDEAEHQWPCEHAPGGAGACADSDCPAYVPSDACARCRHGAVEHDGALHGVPYCRACLRHGVVPLSVVCREYIRPRGAA